MPLDTAAGERGVGALWTAGKGDAVIPHAYSEKDTGYKVLAQSDQHWSEPVHETL